MVIVDGHEFSSRVRVGMYGPIYSLCHPQAFYNLQETDSKPSEQPDSKLSRNLVKVVPPNTHTHTQH